MVEVRVPQAKPLLVRLEPFPISVRPGPSRLTARDEILAVLPELVNERSEFTERSLIARLSPDRQDRRRWAVEKALARLTVARKDQQPLADRVSPGLFRLRA